MRTENGIITAAVLGDLHFGNEVGEEFAKRILYKMANRSDIFFFTGDLIHNGKLQEAEKLSRILESTGKKGLGVLGNHERRGETGQVIAAYERSGLHILDNRRKTLPVADKGLEIIGLTGGYDGSLSTDLIPGRAQAIKRGKRSLVPQLEKLAYRLTHEGINKRVILTHYATSRETIIGENPEQNDLHGSLGISNLADTRPDTMTAIFHGHTHKGQHRGATTGGIPVYNVALPVLGREAHLTREEVYKNPPVCLAQFTDEGLIDVFVSR